MQNGFSGQLNKNPPYACSHLALVSQNECYGEEEYTTYSLLHLSVNGFLISY